METATTPRPDIAISINVPHGRNRFNRNIFANKQYRNKKDISANTPANTPANMPDVNLYGGGESFTDLLYGQQEIGIDGLFDFRYFKKSSCGCFTLRDKILAILIVITVVLLQLYLIVINRVFTVSQFHASLGRRQSILDKISRQSTDTLYNEKN